MAEEQDREITFSSTNSSKEQQNGEQSLQNNFWSLAADIRRPEKQPIVFEGRPRVLSEDLLRPDLRRALGPRREKARRARGEAPKTAGCLGYPPRREKARSTRREAPKTAGCLARTLRVLPIHSDICLQRPALPAPGLN